jgi:hypothetical protein
MTNFCDERACIVTIHNATKALNFNLLTQMPGSEHGKLDRKSSL